MPNNAGFYNGRSEKISEFTTVTTFTDSDYIALVRNGTNLKASYSSLKLDLGVTGSLESVGNEFAPPVLTGTAPDYQIRAIESSKGIVSTVSADFIEFSLDESPLQVTNTVIVSDITDFPEPSGGVITLEDDTTNLVGQQAIVRVN